TSAQAHATIDGLAREFLKSNLDAQKKRRDRVLAKLSPEDLADLFGAVYATELLTHGALDRWTREAGIDIKVSNPRKDVPPHLFEERYGKQRSGELKKITAEAERERERQREAFYAGR